MVYLMHEHDDRYTSVCFHFFRLFCVQTFITFPLWLVYFPLMSSLNALVLLLQLDHFSFAMKIFYKFEQKRERKIVSQSNSDIKFD